MTIYFLTDEQAKGMGVNYIDSIKVKRYPLSPGNVVMGNAIITERRFGKILTRTALRLLEEGG